MKAQEKGLLKFLKDSVQFEIPIYQRKYSWLKEQCEQFWQDVISIGETDEKSHFFGSVVYVISDDLQNSPLFVIDGQQRLTTLTLLLAALRLKVGDNEPYDGFTSKKIQAYYLVNEHETGERYHKLLLTDTDKETLFALITGNPEPENYSRNVKENYEYFKNKIAALDVAAIKDLCRGLTKLMIAEIGLSRGDDNPQLIFESMNSKGLDLTQTDLIRNYIFMGLSSHKQEELYKIHWRPMEKLFGEKFSEFDKFIAAYLILKTGNVPKQQGIYAAFKIYCNKHTASNEAKVENIVADMHRYAEYYCNMALGKERNKKLLSAFCDLNALTEKAYPLLMRLYAAHKNKVISEQGFLRCLRMIESYLFRRMVCNLPSNVLTKTFATLSVRNIPENADYLEDLRHAFLDMNLSRSRYPSDDDFSTSFVAHDNFFKMQSVKYWLQKYENYNRKESVSVSGYTIEHIMPQKLTEEWQKVLGENWEELHRKHLHKAGNLTLTGYNSSYSNKSFAEKQNMIDGFRHSPIRLNRDLAELSSWDINAINKRTKFLAEKSLKIWPSLSQA